MNDVDRSEAVLIADQRQQLESFLHDNRVEVVSLPDGLSEEQARRRLVPSLTTLLGLVKHAAFVERVWFDVALAGRSRAEVGLPDTVDESFELADDDTVGSVMQLYREAWASSVQVAADHALGGWCEAGAGGRRLGRAEGPLAVVSARGRASPAVYVGGYNDPGRQVEGRLGLASGGGQRQHPGPERQVLVLGVVVRSPGTHLQRHLGEGQPQHRGGRQLLSPDPPTVLVA